MKETRVLMVSLPRMLEEIVEAAAAQAPEIRIVRRNSATGTIEDEMERQRPDVVILGLRPDQELESYENLLYARPRVKLLGVAPDGREISLFQLRPQLTPIGNVEPRELIELIRRPNGHGE